MHMHSYTTNDHPHLPQTPPLAGFKSFRAAADTTRRVHRPRASSTPTAHHHHRYLIAPPHERRSIHSNDPSLPASQRTHRVSNPLTSAPVPP
jgi:hypothetical protein